VISKPPGRKGNEERLPSSSFFPHFHFNPVSMTCHDASCILALTTSNATLHSHSLHSQNIPRPTHQPEPNQQALSLTFVSGARELRDEI